MKYLCLAYHEESRIASMSDRDFNTHVAEVFDYLDLIQQSGHYIAAEALEPVHTATTLRVRDGKLTITDGPFAETKEQLGGFFLIEATDLNEAIRIAAKMPPARLGSIEVRPIRTLVLSEERASAIRAEPEAQLSH